MDEKFARLTKAELSELVDEVARARGRETHMIIPTETMSRLLWAVASGEEVEPWDGSRPPGLPEEVSFGVSTRTDA